jgi:3-oxoacyl-[acyl-carrier-protein] synthase-3/clorobiocin biosynthesis protein CloN2
MGPFQGAVGDGAAAVLLSRKNGFARVLSSATTTFAEMESVHREDGPLFPPPVTEGRYMDFGQRASEFQARAMSEGFWLPFVTGHRQRVVDVVEEALADAETGPADITKVLINSMPRGTARDYLDTFGFTVEQSSWEYAESLGHLGAGDHLVALHHLMGTGELRPGDRVLLTGFSPGITYKAMVLEITGASTRDGRR